MGKKHRDMDAPKFLEPEPTSVEDNPASIPETGDALQLVASTPNLPEPPKALLQLRVFAAMAGVRWDQVAGFVSYAKRNKLGPLTMEDWQAEFQKYNNRPV